MDDMEDFSLRPQQLPLETILEENSNVKKAKITKKVEKSPAPRKRSASKSKKEDPPAQKPIVNIETRPKKVDVSGAERKLAEADAYLRKLHEKPKKVPEDGLSELSVWTGESVLNTKTEQKDPKYKANLPDKEQLLEDILMLRQTRNAHEE